jgi:Tol biopolymer transport system component
VNVGGASLTRLTNNSFDGNPMWSPVGQKIAFTRFDPPTSTSWLYVMRLDGSPPELVVGGDAYVNNPDWSPDGTQIVYDCNCFCGRECRATKLRHLHCEL